MALETWQIALIIIAILVMYIVIRYYLRKKTQPFICGTGLMRAHERSERTKEVRKQFEEPLSKIKFKDLDKKTQKRISDIRYELKLKLVWEENQDATFLLFLYEAARDQYKENLATDIFDIMKYAATKAMKKERQKVTIRGVAEEAKEGLFVDGFCLINLSNEEIKKYRGKNIEVTGYTHIDYSLMVQPYEPGKIMRAGTEGPTKVMEDFKIKIIRK